MTRPPSRAVAGLLALLTASFALLVSRPARAQTPAPVEMYAILPLTGNVAFLGQAIQKSMQAIEASTNASGGIRHRPIKFEYLDDGSNPTTAVQLVNTLPKTVSFFFDGGPFASCRATQVIIKDNGPVQFCLSPVMQPAKGSYVYTTSTSVADTLDATMRYMVAQGWTRIGVLDTTDATGHAVDGIMDDLMHQPRNQNVKIVALEHFALADLSVAGQVSRIMAAKPQAIIVGSAGNATGTALRGFNDVGNTLPVETTNGNMTFAQMEAYKSFLPATLLFGAPRWAGPEAVRPGPIRSAIITYQAALKSVGVRPDIGTSLGYDVPLMLVAALRTLGPDATAPQLHDYFDNLHGFAGINGFYDFRSSPGRGLGIKDVVVVRWDGAKGTWIAVSGPAGAPLGK